ncbi:MAG: hypothetical protein L0H55_16115, partial [Candidatus Nitrosocosmicus sp.]|nr:hypothetical protein [Candidatus Nitrosocosmicus sp.]
MNNGVLNIKRSKVKTSKDDEKFEVIGIPDSIYGRNNDYCDYEVVMKIINDNFPNSITINPEGINGVTLVQLLHDTFEIYSSDTRKVERGGEFVEKYTS